MGLRDYLEPFAEIQAKTATGTKPLAVFAWNDYDGWTPITCVDGVSPNMP